MDYSRAIKAYRAAHNLSQAKFAKLVNTYSSTICNFESKKKFPSKEMQKKINGVIYGMKPKMVSIKTVKSVEPIEQKLFNRPIEIIFDTVNNSIKFVKSHRMDDDVDTEILSIMTIKYNDEDKLHRFLKHNAPSFSDELLTRAIA